MQSDTTELRAVLDKALNDVNRVRQQLAFVRSIESGRDAHYKGARDQLGTLWSEARKDRDRIRIRLADDDLYRAYDKAVDSYGRYVVLLQDGQPRPTATELRKLVVSGEVSRNRFTDLAFQRVRSRVP